MFQEGGNAYVKCCQEVEKKIGLNIDHITIGFISWRLPLPFNKGFQWKGCDQRPKRSSEGSECKPFEKCCQNANKEIGQQLDGHVRCKGSSFFFSGSYCRRLVYKYKWSGNQRKLKFMFERELIEGTESL